MTDTTTDRPIVTAFKGFDSDMKCRGFQYETGKTYTHGGPVEMCASGFHACTDPFDVWNYYGPCDARFAEVEVVGPVAEGDGDSKVVAGEIRIVAELRLPEFIGRAVDRIVEMTRGRSDGSSGYSAQIGSSGYYAQIGSSGYSAKIGSSGYSAQIEATGPKAVIASAGRHARVKAAHGAWVSVAEFDDNGDCTGFATGRCGYEGVPADVWLIARDGNLVEEATS